MVSLQNSDTINGVPTKFGHHKWCPYKRLEYHMRDLSKGNVFNHILVLSIPMFIGNVFQQLYNVVDSLIVGNILGKEALAAVGATFPVNFVLISLIVGLTMGMSVVVSQYYGAKDIRRVKAVIDTMVVFTIVAGVVIGSIGFLFSRNIFTLMNLPEEVIPHATAYFKIFIAGIFFTFGYNGLSAILRGLGDSKTPLIFLIIAAVINIFLDLFFIKNLHWGIEGAAWATIISQSIAFFGLVVWLNIKHRFMKINFLKLSFDWDIFARSVKIGLPSGIQQTIVAMSMTLLTAIVGSFGSDVMAGFTVAIRLDSFAVMPSMSISVILTSFVGQNIGAGTLHRVSEAYKASISMAVAISIVVGLAFIFGGKLLVSFFTPDIDVQIAGAQCMRTMGGFYIFLSAMFMNTAVLRGAGDTLIPMFLSIFTLWGVRIPVAYFLSREWSGLGSDGLWWGSPISWIFGFGITFLYLKTGRWKRKAVI